MSHTLANGGSGTVSVNVRPLIKTCPEEAGIGELTLADGTQAIVLGNMFWPSHDRNAISLIHDLLAHKRQRVQAGELPEFVVLLAGNIIHGEAFKQINATNDRSIKLLGKRGIPEIVQIMEEQESPEERWNALAQKAGEFIASFAASSGGHVLYLPAVGQRSEVQLFDYVLEQKGHLDAKVDRLQAKSRKEKGDEDTDEAAEPEAQKGDAIPENFGEFLGLHTNENVTVLPFGAAIRINGMRFQVGNYKRRQPGTASLTDVEHNFENVTRTGDGKVSSAWWTTPIHSLAGSHRRWWQAHEVGNLYDITQQLGYGQNYDRRGKGIWVGTFFGNTVFGTSFPILRGKDKRRSVVVDGVPFDESAAGGFHNVFPMVLPARKSAKLTAAATAPEPEAPTPVASPVKRSAKASGKERPKKATKRTAARRKGSSKRKK